MKQETRELFNWIWNTDARELEKICNMYDKKKKIELNRTRKIYSRMSMEV